MSIVQYRHHRRGTWHVSLPYTIGCIIHVERCTCAAHYRLYTRGTCAAHYRLYTRGTCTLHTLNTRGNWLVGRGQLGAMQPPEAFLPREYFWVNVLSFVYGEICEAFVNFSKIGQCWWWQEQRGFKSRGAPAALCHYQMRIISTLMMTYFKQLRYLFIVVLLNGEFTADYLHIYIPTYLH